MNRINLRQFENIAPTSPQQSLQSTITSPEPEEDINGLIEILGASDITTRLANIKISERIRNENERQIQPPKQPEKDTSMTETSGDVRIGYSRAGSEELSLAMSRQGFRMVPDNTFGTC